MDVEFNKDNHFLNMPLLVETLEEFSWPAPYHLEDDLPDGIEMVFPNSSLFFAEGYAGEIELQFLPKDTHSEVPLKLAHALSVIVPVDQRGAEPVTAGIIDDISIYGSKEKIQNGIRDICTILLTHMKHIILGDFSWVEKYLQTMKSNN